MLNPVPFFLSDLTAQPGHAGLESLRAAWCWLLGERWTPVLFSAIGDVFIELPAGAIWWLSTATGDLEQVADSREHFLRLLDGEQVDEWFLPGLVDTLRAQGKPLSPGQCYSFVTPPVFVAGSFSAENMFPCKAAEHFALAGQIHQSIRGLPDGTPVQVLFGP